MNANYSNIWYLDRGKNFLTKSGQDFFETMISVLNTISVGGALPSSKVKENLPPKYKKSKNCSALLTTIRNIGVINRKNVIGETIKYYLENKLTYKELILENLTKINYDKENTKEVKPFAIICMALYELYCMGAEHAFITRRDCIDYLFDIVSYDKPTLFLQVQELARKERNYSNHSNAVLDIWFNALREFDIFEKTNNKNVLKMNIQEVEFFKYIYDHCEEIPSYPNGDNTFDTIYDELGNSKTGINAIIPKVIFNENINITETSVKEIYSYLFGIDSHLSELYFKQNFYGIYRPFRTMKNIAIRKIEESNYELAQALFEYHLKNNTKVPQTL